MAGVTVEITDVARALNVPGGIVARDMLRRGYKVETKAKELCPVDTGRLRSSITLQQLQRAGVPVVLIGTNVQYASYVHDGTGIYGPLHAPITPKRGRYLVFTPRGARAPVFARSVRGMPGRPFLERALPAALD